jgi:superfamily II DNA or RNA helicase
VDGLHKRGGDYAKGELAARADTQTITGDAVQHYKRLAYGKQFVAFCVSVEHAQHVAQQFTMAGVPAEAVDGKLPHEERKSKVDAFRRRAITGLVSCDLISEGFDVPGIEVGISLRPTASLGLWLQQAGRILRTHPGKDRAILLDHAGNTLRHGLPTDDREWSLDGAPAREKERTIGVKICPSCFAACRSTATYCPQPKCGKPFPIKPREVKVREGELAEVDADQLRRERLIAQSGARDRESLIALGTLRGYRRADLWADHLLAARRRKGRM